MLSDASQVSRISITSQFEKFEKKINLPTNMSQFIERTHFN